MNRPRCQRLVLVFGSELMETCNRLLQYIVCVCVFSSTEMEMAEYKKETIPQCTKPHQHLFFQSQSFPEKTETLTDEAIVYGHNNKTLCASPDDTNDFALANKMASTPYTGTLGHRMSLPNTGSLTKDIRDTAVNVGIPQPEVDSRKTLRYTSLCTQRVLFKSTLGKTCRSIFDCAYVAH